MRPAVLRGGGRHRRPARSYPRKTLVVMRERGGRKIKQISRRTLAGGGQMRGSGRTEYFYMNGRRMRENGATTTTGVSAANEGVGSGVKRMRRESEMERYERTRELPERRPPSERTVPNSGPTYNSSAQRGVVSRRTRYAAARSDANKVSGLAHVLAEGAGARPLFPQRCVR